MPARTVVESLAGAKIGISASLPATFDAAGYDVSSLQFTPIGNVETYGNHGMTATVTEFTPVDTAVITKLKGAKNYGTMTMSLAYIPGDTGQTLVRTASESPNHYSIEIRYQDGEFHYLDVLVTKFEFVDGSVNDARKVSFDFAICRPPVIILAP